MHSQLQNLKQQDGRWCGVYSDTVRYIINFNFNTFNQLLSIAIIFQPITHIPTNKQKSTNTLTVSHLNHYNNNKYFPYNQNHLTIIKNQTQKMKKMSTTRRLSVKQLPIQHCKDDIACLHCCSCWQKHKKQFDIKLDMWMRKSEESRKEVEFLTKLNKELMGQLNGCKLRLKKLGNIQEIKQQFRKQIYQQVIKQRQIEDQITAQKLQTLQQSLQTTLQSLHTLQQTHQQTINKLEQIEHELHQSQQQNLLFKQQNTQLKQQINEIQQKTLELYDVIKKYQNRIDQKQAVIQQLRASVGELEGKFMVERAKAYSVGADRDVLEVNLKNKELYIESLTKCSQENLKNLNNLQFTNAELKKLVNNLDYQVTAGRYNQNYFKDRLLSSQHQLALTEGLARYHSQKVEMMKGDLQLLKFTI